MKIEGMPVIVIGVSPEEKLLRSIFGETESEPYIEEYPSCECGKWIGERYEGIICDSCGTEVEARKVVVAPYGWKKAKIIASLKESGEIE